MGEELAAIPVDLIVTWGTPATLAAKHATKTIPVVMGSVADPVSAGIVASLARPREHTGFSALNVDLEGKRLELLKDFLPGITRVAILGNNTNPTSSGCAWSSRTRAPSPRRQVGKAMIPWPERHRGPRAFDGAFAKLAWPLVNRRVAVGPIRRDHEIAIGL